MMKVLLADDHKIVRDGLRTLLAHNADVQVVGEAENGRTTVQLAQKLTPDIIIMDVAMPDLNGIEATRQILVELPGVKVIAVSMHSDRRFVSEMLKAGASAYLSKDYAFDELEVAIRAVTAGKIYLSPDISGVVVENYVRQTPKTESSAFSLLSDREREVLQLLAEGKTAKEIAEHIHVSIKTVETHRMNIMTKLDIHRLAELTKYAIREGLTPL
ncbi:MAG: response regulator transcription factor [Nitrospiraceae bacterium]|nr:response regulator transcription factor [Nitrospiraceae bacterium]